MRLLTDDEKEWYYEILRQIKVENVKPGISKMTKKDFDGC